MKKLFGKIFGIPFFFVSYYILLMYFVFGDVQKGHIKKRSLRLWVCGWYTQSGGAIEESSISD